MTPAVELDVAVFGGAAAGLWLLDELVRRGYQALLFEAHELGHGQTITSQGILHGGLKYTLSGCLTSSARRVRDMPQVWRECLAGRRDPDLRGTRVRGAFCYLWATGALVSRIGMLGARRGLYVRPVRLEAPDRPAVLARCADVFRLDEQVLDVASFIACLAGRHRDRLLKVDADDGVEFEVKEPGCVTAIRLHAPGQHHALALRPRAVVFTAGEGNAQLRARAALSPDAMQRRPLHMVLVRGPLPCLHGHCAHGARTRVTITWEQDREGRGIWQVGGQVAEDGVRMEPAALTAHAKRELLDTIPGLKLDGVEWATYRIDRAEPRTRSGLRPSDAWCRRRGNVITAWPTKLALVPRLAELILAQLEPPASTPLDIGRLAGWPAPCLARPPWEGDRPWRSDV